MARRSVGRSKRGHRHSKDKHINPIAFSLPLKFLKPVYRITLEKNKLKLPTQLVKNFGNQLTNEVAVLGFPNGFFMRVRLLEDNGKVWLDISKLVQHFHIREKFILEFTYKGFSNFKVHIFDPSTSYFQIEYPCDNASSGDSSSSSEEVFSGLKQCSLHHDDVESDDNSINNNVSTPDPHKGQSSRKKSLPKSSVAVDVRNKTRRSVSVASAAKRANLKHKLYRTRSQISTKEEEVVNVDSSDEDEINIELEKNKTHRLTKKRIRTNAGSKDMKSIASQKFQSLVKKLPDNAKRALEAANKFKHQNPSFHVVLRGYNFRLCTLNVPSEFSKKYMNNVSKQITLVAPDRTEWLVKIRVTQLRYLTFGNGWGNFSKHSHLKEGDVCLFELVRYRGFTLKVSVFSS